MLCFCIGAQAQSMFMSNSKGLQQTSEDGFSVFSSITKYLAAGDAASLSTWFADNLDVTIFPQLFQKAGPRNSPQFLPGQHPPFLPGDAQGLRKQ